VGGTIDAASPPFPHFGLRKTQTHPASAGVGGELGGALRLVGPHGCGTTRPRRRHAFEGPTPAASTISRLRRLPEGHESDALQI
jgi:hypothetical protein